MTAVPNEGLLGAVRGYACEVMGCSSERIAAVGRFESGNRHAVHKVSYLDDGDRTRHVVVRVSYGADGVECAQAEREAVVLAKVGGVAGPVLHDFSRTSRWFDTPAMCMSFLPGHPREVNSVGLEEIGQLASVVAWVHERPAGDLAEPLAAAGDLVSYTQDRLRSIMSTLVWARDPLPAPLQAGLRQVADSLATTFEASQDADSFRTTETLALLHGDIAVGNVLWGPEPALIDWEYTRLGDPADEIAYVFDQNSLTESQRQAFWDGYRVSVGTRQRLGHIVDRVGWWEPVTLLGSTLWWVERWVRRTELDIAGATDPAVQREPDYYLANVVARLDRLEALRPAEVRRGGGSR